MKKRIGFIALGVGILDLFAWIFIIFSGSAFSPNGGFSPIVPFCFVLWFVCVITVIFCLAETFLKFVGKNLGIGNSFNFEAHVHKETPASYCTECGKPLQGTVKFCPHCGAKQ